MRTKAIWINADTGEIKERSFTGRDPVVWAAEAPSNPTGEPQFRGEYDEWEMSALEMALEHVPDLETVMDMARLKGRDIVVTVRLGDEPK